MENVNSNTKQGMLTGQNDPSAATSLENVAPALHKEPASGELAAAPCSAPKIDSAGRSSVLESRDQSPNLFQIEYTEERLWITGRKSEGEFIGIMFQYFDIPKLIGMLGCAFHQMSDWRQHGNPHCEQQGGPVPE